MRIENLSSYSIVLECTVTDHVKACSVVAKGPISVLWVEDEMAVVVKDDPNGKTSVVLPLPAAALVCDQAKNAVLLSDFNQALAQALVQMLGQEQRLRAYAARFPACAEPAIRIYLALESFELVIGKLNKASEQEEPAIVRELSIMCRDFRNSLPDAFPCRLSGLPLKEALTAAMAAATAYETQRIQAVEA